jgi:hypothetical protein
MKIFTSAGEAISRRLTVLLLSTRPAPPTTCKYVEIEFLSNGTRTRNWRVCTSHFNGFSWFQDPSRSGFEQTWALNQAQDVVLVNEQIEIIYAISAILLVIEVDPEPSARLAIKEIKRSRFWIALNG